MIVGYSRVSTCDQNLDLQIHDLKNHGCEKIYQEKVSSIKSRPELDAVLNFIREGDTLVVWKLDRLGRSLKDLIYLLERIQLMGVNFVSLNDNINTDTAMGKLLFHIIAAFAQYERDMITERTKAGLKAARLKGHFAGRPKGLGKKAQKTAAIAWALAQNPKYTVGQIVDDLDISKATYYRYIKWASTEEFKKLYDGKKIKCEFFTGEYWVKKTFLVDAAFLKDYEFKNFRNIK